jgi:hypothetical protein
MRRSLLLPVVAALALVAAASAKETWVTVSPSSAAPRAGVPWTVTIRVERAGKPWSKPGYRPLVMLFAQDGSPAATFRGVATGTGRYSVRIVFPYGGTWRYSVVDPVTGDWYFVAPRVAA